MKEGFRGGKERFGGSDGGEGEGGRYGEGVWGEERERGEGEGKEVLYYLRLRGHGKNCVC